LAFAILLTAFTIPSPTAAAVIHTMEYAQLSFIPLDGGEPTLNSTMGELKLALDAGPDTEYLNIRAAIPGLTIEPYWIVRNLLLHDDTVGAPYEEYALRFPLDVLGVESGMLVGSIMYGFTVAITPLLDDDYQMWAAGVPLNESAPMMHGESAIGRAGVTFDPDVFDPSVALPDSAYTPFADLSDSTIAGILGCLVGNVELDSTTTVTDKNGCVPAACANSLDWLRGSDDSIEFPGTLRDTYNKLSQLMNRNSPEGVWPEDMMQAKLDFIEAYNLPIEVKYQNRFPRRSPVSSTSGESSAVDKGAASTFPTAAWLKNEVKDHEDVEANVSYCYMYRDTLRFDGAHCVVVTGAGRSASGDWVFIKHDNDQRSATPAELKQVPSGIVTGSNGEMFWPGLGYWKTMPDNTKAFVWPRVDSVISESPKEDVTGPPGEEALPGYCTWFARTIPPNGALELDFPEAGAGRCYNTTLGRLDRTTTPPTIVVELQWNLNKGKTRTWRNDQNYPVTVFVHNDDHSPDGMDVGVHVAQVVTGTIDPGNPFDYAGFSLGGADGSAGEFSPVLLPAFVSTGPIMPGFSLADVPGRLAELGATSHLQLLRDIPVPNIYWGEMGLVVDVLAVDQAGDIHVDCPSTGLIDVLHVTAPGRYELTLGDAMGAPMFEVNLIAQNGLDIILDSLGVPSLVPAQDTAVDDGATPPRLTLAAWPNPFNPSVTLTFGLPAAGGTELAVFDLRGRRVRTLLRAELSADEHAVTWDGRDDAGHAVPAGSYLCRLTSGGERREERVTLVK